jgi:autotransporter-associated beta strand protein
MKKTVLYAAVLSLLTAVAQAQNANVTWQSPTAVSGASDVSTLGSYVGSWAPYDGNANNLPVNGVSFQGNSDITDNSQTGFNSGYNGFPNPGTANNNYNALLQYGAYDGSGSGNVDTMTWSDIPGHTYLIELWVNGNAAGRSETFTGGTNTSATINFGSSAQYIIGTYVADGSGLETLSLNGSASSNGNAPQVNLFLIRDITQGNITWQAPANISGASDVNTQGTYFGSWAPYDGNANSLPVNGVTFQGNSDLPGLNAYFPNHDQSGYNGFHNPGTPNSNYNTLLQTATYCGTGNGTIVVSWKDIPGHTYLVQVWADDGRGIFPGRSENVIGGTNTSANVDFGDAPGQYVIGTYVANSSSEAITLSGSSSGDSPMINLLQVRDITPVTAATNYQSVVLADHPLGFWPLNLNVDTGSIATDISGNGNDGTYYSVGAVAGPSTNIPNAANFNGSEVDLSTGTNTASMDFSGPTTIEAWVQPADSTTTPGDIMAKGYDGSFNDQEIVLRENGGNYYGSLGSAGVSGGVQNTNWVHLVLADDGTNEYLYINGSLAQQSSDQQGSIVFFDPIQWAIGNGSDSGDGRTFNGNICQVALYNYGLTPTQVYAHYFAGQYGTSPSNSVPIITAQPAPQVSYTGGGASFSVTVLSVLPTTNQWYKGSTPISGATNETLVLTNVQPGDAVNYHVVVGNINGPTTSSSASLTLSLPAPTAYESTVLKDGPLAFYPLDPNVDSSTTAYDWSGNGNNGVYTGASGQVISGPNANIPNASSFSGSTFANLSAGPNENLLNFGGQITLEAWVQPANVTQNLQDILAKGYDANQNYDEIVLRQDSATYTGNGGSGGVAQVGTWAHVVSTYDGTNWNTYVNGSLVAQSQSGSGATYFVDPWSIGDGSVSGNGRWFTGNLSQVALYNYGLTPEQVLTHYFVGEYGVTPSNSIPLITVQPQSQTAYLGNTVNFNVTVLSVLATTNQWYKGSSAILGQTNTTLTLTNVQSGAAANYHVVIGNINGTTNSATVSLSFLTPGISLQWSAANNSGSWDTDTSTNWVNLANEQPSAFFTNDQVLFDDTTGVPTTVTVNGTVAPSVITVNANNNNFTFNSPGTISGPGSIVKEGSSTLTINSSSTLTGSVYVSGGTLIANNNSIQDATSIVITNNSTLDVAGNSYQNNQPVTVSGTGVGGEGAIYSSVNNYPTENFAVTLAGNTTFGGQGRWDMKDGSINGPYTLTLAWQDPSQSFYSQWTSVSVGANVAGIILTNANANANPSQPQVLGSIGMDTGFQNPATTFTVSTNSELFFYGGSWNGSLHILDGGEVQTSQSIANLTGSTITFENGGQFVSYSFSANQAVDSAIVLNGTALLTIGDHNIIYTNVISGPGGMVIEQYNHEMVFSAANTYTGPTIINSGPEIALTGSGSISQSPLIFFGGGSATTPHIDVTGRTDETLTLASGQTLQGIGAINGSLTVSAGATITPGGTNTTIGITTGSNPVGTLAASGSVTLAGTTTIKLDGSTNDVIAAAGEITYGGTLNLVNISGSALAAGNSFQIFNNAATYSGTFAANNIVPATPGTGLTWDLSHLSNGVIKVAGSAGPVIGSTTVSGGNLILSGTGGTASSSYSVLTTTNLTLPLTSWTQVATGTYSTTGTFTNAIAIVPGVPQSFYIIK